MTPPTGMCCMGHTESMRDLKTEKKKELSQVQCTFRDDMKAQLDELSTEINQQINTTTDRIEEVAKHLGEMERNIVGKEKRRDRFGVYTHRRCGKQNLFISE